VRDRHHGREPVACRGRQDHPAPIPVRRGDAGGVTLIGADRPLPEVLMLFNPSETVRWEAFQLGAEDAHGNPTESWADPVEKDILAFDPGSTSEPTLPGHDRVVVEPTIYAPSGVVMGARDRVSVRGVLYEVEGVTREWSHPHLDPKGSVI